MRTVNISEFHEVFQSVPLKPKMSCSKMKDVHDIDDFEEMYRLMKSLGVSTKKLKGLEDMKSRVKEFVEKAKSRQSWSAEEVRN